MRPAARAPLNADRHCRGEPSGVGRTRSGSERGDHFWYFIVATGPWCWGDNDSKHGEHAMDHTGDYSATLPVESESQHANDSTVHTSIQMRAGFLAVRDAISADADAYVNYWHYSGERIKNLLGIDRERLGTPEDSRKRFSQMIRVPGFYQPNVIFTITLNGHVVGYTNINRYGPDNSYVHLHTYHSYLRLALKSAGESGGSPKTGASVAAVLIGLVGGYFELFPLRRVIFQTRTTNHGINRALDLYMPPAETKYVLTPPGLAAPGECHIRYVLREDVPWMISRAKFLGSRDQQLRKVV